MQSAVDTNGTRATRLLWVVFGALMIANIPIFLCQHLTPDAVLYDLQARSTLNGGVLYRDFAEPNFPGAVWIHMAVRSLLGWSTVALRAFDLIVFAGTTLLLANLMRSTNETFFTVRTAGLFLATFGLYFTVSEWCHCQRDIWMMFPALAAVTLRANRLVGPAADRSLSDEIVRWPSKAVESCSSTALEGHRTDMKPISGNLEEKPSGAFRSTIVEGLLWGIAFWIKPHIAIPALAVIGLSALMARNWKSIATDLIGVILGGFLIGGVGSAWMMATGAWAPFWEMQLHWNPEYLEAGRSRFSLERMSSMWSRFLPWSWLHLLAVPMSLISVRRCLAVRWPSNTVATGDSTASEDHRTETDLHTGELNETRSAVSRLLLCGLYLGWAAQVLLLQHPFAYVHLPIVVLATAITIGIRPSVPQLAIARPAWIAFTILAMMGSPAVSVSRLQHWPQCVVNGPTPEVKAAIQSQISPEWTEVQPVLQYLEGQSLEDGELTVYPGSSIAIYSELGLQPPNRFIYLDAFARAFPSRVEEIHRAVEQSPQRFIVSSLRDGGMSREQIRSENNPQTNLPMSFPEDRLEEFPFTQPVVFRSGQYCVHRVSEPIGRLCTEYLPLRENLEEDQERRTVHSAEINHSLPKKRVAANKTF